MCKYLSYLPLLASPCPFAQGNYEEVSGLGNNWSKITDLVADPGTTTPNGCTCTSICSCGDDCDPGMRIPQGETRDWCNTGEV